LKTPIERSLLFNIFTPIMLKNRSMLKSAVAEKETPLMKQYFSIKAKYPDAILLFRVGDFYETFSEDAIKASKVLGIVLTRRANGAATFVELAGFPYHSLDSYLPKLVRAGHRVAICDQLEDPKLTKTIVKRGVTELVTPGVASSDRILEHKKNNFLAALYEDGKTCGLALIDISTGEFLVFQGTKEQVDKLLQNFSPNEIVYNKNRRKEFLEEYGSAYHNFALDEWIFQRDYAHDILQKHFDVVSLKGFGIEEMEAAIIAAGAAFHYVSDTRQEQLKHVSGISRIEENSYVWLDRFTIRNLELVSSANEKAVTLIDVLDKTVTSMGGRLLKRWLILPLKDINAIEERLEAVNYLLHHSDFRLLIMHHLNHTGDLERLISKVALGKASPRDIQQLQRSLDLVSKIKEECSQSDNPSLRIIADQLNACAVIRDKIFATLHNEPPVALNKGMVINSGVSVELDNLREIAYHGKDYLLQLQKREAERTGISSLKVAFNSVFGYYIEVTHTHKDKVPADWHRKQTLTNAERYITEELKQYEEKILGAEEKILALETKLFNELVQSVFEYIKPIQHNASLLARLDCFCSFAEVAGQYDYVRAQINDSKIIDIKNGRHAVIERNLPAGEKYIANDIYLDTDTQQILMITGPNMSGKSALLRQTALIVLLAQTGSFVPALAASIGIVDKIFSRVGASDNISSGESTFMVEMNETASILHNLSDRSLILLDEIGRGTSTYDGISIAWAIAEFIHGNGSHRAKTLFATHYHELNEMEDANARIKNYHVSIKEIDNKVLFLRKLVKGGSEHSFGIHVAKMAGIPSKVVNRASEILKQLEQTRQTPESKGKKITQDNMQLSIFQLDDPVLEQIREEILNIDVNNLTPIEALNKLNEIKKILKG
jgi:DNA mismatch repair protein MutS